MDVLAGIFISHSLSSIQRNSPSKSCLPCNWSDCVKQILLLCAVCVGFDEMLCANITRRAENARKIENCAVTGTQTKKGFCACVFVGERYHVARIVLTKSERQDAYLAAEIYTSKLNSHTDAALTSRIAQKGKCRCLFVDKY